MGKEPQNDPSEKEFLKGYDITKYDRPSVTADVVVFSVQDIPTGNYRKPFESRMCVLLIERGAHPFKGSWALPGGFLRKGETIEECAARELREETSLNSNTLLLIGTFSKPNRDPRGWIISSAFVAIVKKSASFIMAGDDAAIAKWTPVDEVLSKNIELAFDHFEIIEKAIERLRFGNKDELAFEFLPKEFTIAELQFVHEFIEGHPLLGPNFRRRMKNLIEETDSNDNVTISHKKLTNVKKFETAACCSIKTPRNLYLIPLAKCVPDECYNKDKKEKKISYREEKPSIKEEGVGHRPATYFKKKANKNP